MGLKPGTSDPDEWNGSMAEAIENALAREYEAVKAEPFPSYGVEDRRMLFTAIAQGVIKHLTENMSAFTVSVEVQQVTGESGTPLIRSDNPNSIPVSSGSSIASHAVDVEQINAPDNLVKSRGDGTVTDIDIEGILY
jgi:hypothetical protein